MQLGFLRAGGRHEAGRAAAAAAAAGEEREAGGLRRSGGGEVGRPAERRDGEGVEIGRRLPDARGWKAQKCGPHGVENGGGGAGAGGGGGVTGTRAELALYLLCASGCFFREINKRDLSFLRKIKNKIKG